MSEKAEARRNKGKLHKNSGRGMKKADMTVGPFCVDIKESQYSFTLNKNVWAKVCTDAFNNNQEGTPALKIILGTERKVRLWVVDDSVIEDYVRLKNEEVN